MRLVLACALCAAPLAAAAAEFDHTHRAWNALLEKHVVVAEGGESSRVDYAGFAADRGKLQTYLDALSALERPVFERWSRAERLAFLINAYNAFTVELVLRNYPGLGSIRDLGNVVFASPWKKRFFTLLGEPQHLDGIEHGMIRAPGAYDEPRIHFAVNCASIGCPMLREEAYVPARLDAQLEEQTARFLSDRSRNRYDAARGVLEVSRIFDWYAKDFATGVGGIGSLGRFLARYADALDAGAQARERIATGAVPVRFLDYDWRLNDIPR